MPRWLPRPDRFFALVVQAPSGCLEWSGRIDQNGYGKFGSDWAHRVAWELAKGARVGPGLQLDHRCRNTRCVNTAHLEPVTPGENVRRSRAALPRAACPRGHAYTPSNVYRSERQRFCRECGRRRNREFRARQRLVKATGA